MREKELRLALVCYGGISLAVYMHGITKEVWRLVRASRAFHAGGAPSPGVETVYHDLLARLATTTETRLRVLADIVTGASAGGINGIFLAQAIVSGQSLDPLTGLWLEVADVERLLDPAAKPWSRFSKAWAQPLVWAAARRGDTIERTVEADTRDEVRAKLSALIRGRWFEPPFGGKEFLHLLMDAFDAMANAPAGPALLPDGHPLDLAVTITDFHGHAERLTLHSPPQVLETEHRATAAFTDRGQTPRTLGAAPGLAFAARATASFPGAFPPFTVAELDAVLAERGRSWGDREAFLARILPDHAKIGAAERAVLIDGSVLANAPFEPAIAALADRPSRREVDRRIVYIDPKPSIGPLRLHHGGEGEQAIPGFLATILGALSDLPRSQPIRDNLEEIARRSTRIVALRDLIDRIRPEVDAAIDANFGQPLFIDRPSPARLLAWRARAQDAAAKAAGYAYAAYGHLKLAGVLDDLAALVATLSRGGVTREAARAALAGAARAGGVDAPGALTARGASAAAIGFFRSHDVSFRVRRLRFVARRLQALEERQPAGAARPDTFRAAVYATLSTYLDRQRPGFYDETARAAACICADRPQATLDWLADLRGLKAVDDHADAVLAEALADLPRPERREMLLAYLGFPFYDIATLPLLAAGGLDGFDPVKVDRIAPDDATAIRAGGAAATLKGIQFNGFGAFFSRAWRENDYLWGRLHGAERMIDILASAIPDGRDLPPGLIATAKRDAFRAILREEGEALTAVPELVEALRREVG